MRILKLCLKNLNNSQQEIKLDFTVSPLAESNLTVVTVSTGAGKTTLLDVLRVALYAKTPRLSETSD
jgi:exonuclease SbcC